MPNNNGNNMLKFMRGVRNALKKLLEGAVILMMAALVLVVLWGVISRSSGSVVAWLGRKGIDAWFFLPRGQSKWTEELAIYLLVWVSLLGSALAYAAKAHLGLDFLSSKLDPAAARLMDILTNVLSIFFVCAAFIWGGLVLVTQTLASNQLSPILGIKVGYVYLAVPLSGSFILLFAVESIIQLLSGKTLVFQGEADENQMQTDAVLEKNLY